MERKFRLAGLLRLRKLQEERAAALLATSNYRLRTAVSSRDGRQLALSGHTLPDGDYRAFAAAVAARGTLGDLLVEATEVVGGARGRVATDTSAWSATRSRSVGLEKLEDKHRVLVDHEDDRLEQLVLDEIASRLPRSGAGLATA